MPSHLEDLIGKHVHGQQHLSAYGDGPFDPGLGYGPGCQDAAVLKFLPGFLLVRVEDLKALQRAVAAECAAVFRSVNNSDNPMTANDCADEIAKRFDLPQESAPPKPAPEAGMLDVLRRAANAIESLDGTSVENEKLVDDYRALMARRA